MILETYSATIAMELNIASAFVRNAVKLLEEGATIPFIARYRKEMTGSMDETIITKIRDRLRHLKELDARRETILKSLSEQEKLTPELREAVTNASTLSELEDIYLPFKPKRKTRASIAKEKGLEPLAKIIYSQKYDDIEEKALTFMDESKGLPSLEAVYNGACDIIAEWINEDSYARKRIRYLFQKEGMLCSRLMKDKEQEGANYRNYFDYRELLTRAPSHRVLAILRGENEKLLSVSIEVEEEKAIDILEKIFL